MTVCNVVIMKEVIELIRQSDYFVDGELNFDLKLQKTADFLNSFGPEGLKPDEKLSDSEEKRLISRAYQDAKILGNSRNLCELHGGQPEHLVFFC